MEENKKKIMGTLEENVAYMNEVLPVKESFDLVQRDIVIGVASTLRRGRYTF